MTAMEAYEFPKFRPIMVFCGASGGDVVGVAVPVVAVVVPFFLIACLSGCRVLVEDGDRKIS